jgi:dihydroorotate dehydrogenase
MSRMRTATLDLAYRWLRPLLFRLDPEAAHEIGLAALNAFARSGWLNPLRSPPLLNPREVLGLRFPNPVGLAAGMDKNGDCIKGLAALGFGFIELGTVTPRPQPGNPKPRLFRLPDAGAVINRMGFNNKGVDYLVERVRAAHYGGVLGINIGKNRDTPNERALDDYLFCLRRIYPHAAYVTVNISSPNTPGLRDLQHEDSLRKLLSGLKIEQYRLQTDHGRYVPLLLKIAPDLELADVETIATVVREQGIDGVVATNTTAGRPALVRGLPFAEESGGLSGRPLAEPSTRVIRHLRTVASGELPLIGCGGIFSATDAQEKIDAGADLVQIYTGFIYRGPALIPEIVAGVR